MSRLASSCALLLLVVTLLSRAEADQPASTGSTESWAPLPGSGAPTPPAAAPDSPAAQELVKSAKLKGQSTLDQPPAGFHDVKLPFGGVIRVRDQTKTSMRHDTVSGDNYDPQDADFSRTSSFAHKAFSSQDVALSKSETAAEITQQPYATSAYGTSSFTQGDRTFKTAAYHPSTSSSDDFTKAFTLPSGPADAEKSFAVKPSELQDQQAKIAQTQLKMDPLSRPDALNDKTFYDPALRKVQRDKYATNGLDVNRLTSLPNRPLTIDEVRALINHDQIPNLDAPAESPSKALNDPGWEPPLKLPDISDKAAATPPQDENDGELPSPGMMAQPTPGGAVSPQK
jgi:hypothetical protein